MEENELRAKISAALTRGLGRYRGVSPAVALVERLAERWSATAVFDDAIVNPARDAAYALEWCRDRIDSDSAARLGLERAVFGGPPGTSVGLSADELVLAYCIGMVETELAELRAELFIRSVFNDWSDHDGCDVRSQLEGEIEASRSSLAGLLAGLPDSP